jgi:replicative DNA helicase
MNQQHKVQLLVIDYLQLIKSSSRHSKAADISLGIKALAKELNIPIIMLSKLNRRCETRDYGEPWMADLHDYGSLEEAADIVGLLLRPELYEDDDESRKKLKGQATLFIAKNRTGPTGDINLSFISESTRFEYLSNYCPDDSSSAKG